MYSAFGISCYQVKLPNSGNFNTRELSLATSILSMNNLRKLGDLSSVPLALKTGYIKQLKNTSKLLK